MQFPSRWLQFGSGCGQQGWREVAWDVSLRQLAGVLEEAMEDIGRRVVEKTRIVNGGWGVVLIRKSQI